MVRTYTRKSAPSVRKGPEPRTPAPPRSSLHGPHRSQQGFTLIELLTVLAIIGILIGMVFALSGGVWRRARHARAVSQLETLADILDADRIKYATYPATLSDIADRLPPGFKTGTNGIPLDPWNQLYVYFTNSPHAYTLYSHGPDGPPDGTDDPISRIYPGR